MKHHVIDDAVELLKVEEQNRPDPVRDHISMGRYDTIFCPRFRILPPFSIKARNLKHV